MGTRRLRARPGAGRSGQDGDAARPAGTESTEPGDESGFTLIELMVVLLIMAILLAIAIPTFLSVTNGARRRPPSPT